MAASRDKVLSFMRRHTYKKEVVYKRSPVFGAPLPETEKDLLTGRHVLYVLVEYLQMLDGVHIEGIFRISGSMTEIRLISSAFDTDPDNVDLESMTCNPATIAGLIKKFFRNLPEPLLTFELYDCFIAAESIWHEESRMKCLRQLLGYLPPVNGEILLYLVTFLCQVASKSHINKMSAKNLAVVFAPNLLRSEEESLENEMLFAKPAARLLETFIDQFDECFADLYAPSFDLGNAYSYEEEDTENTEGTCLRDDSGNVDNVVVPGPGPENEEPFKPVPLELLNSPSSLPLTPRRMHQSPHLLMDFARRHSNTPERRALLNSIENAAHLRARTHGTNNDNDGSLNGKLSKIACNEDSDDYMDYSEISELHSGKQKIDSFSMLSASLSVYPNGISCIALYSFVSEHENEISFHVGDSVFVIQLLKDGWCYGSLPNSEDSYRKGLLPSAYVRVNSEYQQQSHKDNPPTTASQLRKPNPMAKSLSMKELPQLRLPKNTMTSTAGIVTGRPHSYVPPKQDPGKAIGALFKESTANIETLRARLKRQQTTPPPSRIAIYQPRAQLPTKEDLSELAQAFAKLARTNSE